MAHCERHYEYSPYHYCAVCGYRRPLAEMAWQLGALVCSDPAKGCFDTEIIGVREKRISRVLIKTGQEMMPDKKLTSPGALNSSVEEIIL